MKIIGKLKEKIRRTELEREAPYAVLATYVGVESGLSPLRSFEYLSELESLEGVREEVDRIRSSALLGLRHLSEQLTVESKNSSGTWGKLISTLASIEATGLNLVSALRDLVKMVLRDLKTDYEKTARRFQTMVSSASVLFGAFPMMVAVMLSILASSNIVPLMMLFLGLNLITALVWLIIVDVQVPEVMDYTAFYRRILIKYLPPGLAAGSAVYFGLLYTPLTLVFHKALSLCIGTLVFSIPAYIEWRLQDKVTQQLMDDLPRFLRDVAEQTGRGFSVHQALENSYSVGGYGRYTMKLLSLIVKEARIHGSLRSAYVKVRKLLPKQWRVSLELLTLIEEAGAGSGAVHSLADAMGEYVLMIREFRRSTSSYKYLSLGLTALTVALIPVSYTHLTLPTTERV